MFKAVTTALVLGMSLAFVADLSAAKKERRHNGPPGGQPNFSRIDMMLRGLTLTEEQKTKVAELKKVYDPKLKENRTKFEGLMTDEQKKASREAMDKAKADGKKGKDIWEAGQAAAKFTPEQKAKLDEARKASQVLEKELHEKVVSILTPEQKEQLKKAREEMKKKRPEVN
jgi:Spy/CpxP family protein refolding chaperone